MLEHEELVWESHESQHSWWSWAGLPHPSHSVGMFAEKYNIMLFDNCIQLLASLLGSQFFCIYMQYIYLNVNGGCKEPLDTCSLRKLGA